MVTFLGRREAGETETRPPGPPGKITFISIFYNNVIKYEKKVIIQAVS